MESKFKLIRIDPGIRFGRPTFKGTRIAVGDVLQWLASGMTNTEIKNDFPEITDEHIHEALYFASERENNTRIVEVEK